LPSLGGGRLFYQVTERRRGEPEGSPELALPAWQTLLTKQKKDGSPLEDYYEATHRPLLEALADFYYFFPLLPSQ
jgi:hypothetical protein